MHHRWASRWVALLVVSALTLGSAVGRAQGTANLLVFGDSLSAGYGLAQGESWVNLLQRRIQEQGLRFHVVNASISGETTSGGKSRIDAALSQFSPTVVVFELGANDGLRGSSLALMRANLEYMIEQAKKRKTRVVVVGMRLPTNYGQVYTTQFTDSFKDVAAKEKTAYVPFLFEGLKDEPGNFQPDGLHPTARAQSTLLDNIWLALKPLLAQTPK